MKLIVDNGKGTNKILRTKCEEVTVFGKETSKIVRDLFEANNQYRGVGLAAPQIESTKRIFVIDTFRYDKFIPGYRSAFINPKITKKSKEQEEDEEACLSEPKIRVKVNRAKEIEVEFYDLAGNVIQEKLSGDLARIFQHELDHLDGILLIDYIKKND